jgi:hypothetical protein
VNWLSDGEAISLRNAVSELPLASETAVPGRDRLLD